ncbi:MAG: hypothetical protein ACRDM0_12990, partial [Thermoleophilaceae bacterium]
MPVAAREALGRRRERAAVGATHDLRGLQNAAIALLRGQVGKAGLGSRFRSTSGPAGPAMICRARGLESVLTSRERDDRADRQRDGGDDAGSELVRMLIDRSRSYYTASQVTLRMPAVAATACAAEQRKRLRGLRGRSPLGRPPLLRPVSVATW